MSTSSLHATTRRLDATVDGALGVMSARPWSASALHLVGNHGTACTHATVKPAAKAAYTNAIGDGIRVSRGTG